MTRRSELRRPLLPVLAPARPEAAAAQLPRPDTARASSAGASATGGAAPPGAAPGSMAAAATGGLSRGDAARTLRSARDVYLQPRAALTVALQVVDHGLGVAAQLQLSRAAGALAHGTDALPAFAGFFALALLARAVPRALAEHSGLAWQHAALHHYDRAFVADERARPRLWAMRQGPDIAPTTGGPVPNQQATRTTLFKERLRWQVCGLVDSTRALLDGAVQAALLVGLFAYAMSPVLAVAVAVSVGLGQLVGWRLQESCAAQARQRTAADGQVMQQGLLMFDNLLLGNTLNRDTWAGELAARRADWQRTRSAHRAARIGHRALGLTAASLPLALGAAAYLAGAPGDLAASLPLWPQLVHMAALGEGLRSAVWGTWRVQRVALADTLAAIAARPELDVAAHMRAEAITVAQDGGIPQPLPLAWPALRAAVQHGAPGRWTLRGENGAGKSMAMVALMAEAVAAGEAAAAGGPPAAAALMLPAKHALDPGDAPAGSVGEATRHHLRRAVAAGVQVLLLDEIGANLSPAAIAQVDAELDATALTVVEVRHR